MEWSPEARGTRRALKWIGVGLGGLALGFLVQVGWVIGLALHLGGRLDEILRVSAPILVPALLAIGFCLYCVLLGVRVFFGLTARTARRICGALAVVAWTLLLAGAGPLHLEFPVLTEPQWRMVMAVAAFLVVSRFYRVLIHKLLIRAEFHAPSATLDAEPVSRRMVALFAFLVWMMINGVAMQFALRHEEYAAVDRTSWLLLTSLGPVVVAAALYRIGVRLFVPDSVREMGIAEDREAGALETPKVPNPITPGGDPGGPSGGGEGKES